MSDATQTQEVLNSSEKHYEIVVNAHPKTVTSNHVTYEEIVTLAMGANYPNPSETLVVTFEDAIGPRHDGVMIDGEVVHIKEGTIFSVETSNKS